MRDIAMFPWWAFCYKTSAAKVAVNAKELPFRCRRFVAAFGRRAVLRVFGA